MAALLFSGFSEGFPLPSFSGAGCLVYENLPSVIKHTDLVADTKEVQEGRVEGPFKSPSFSDFRISPLGLGPKKGSSSFRMIHHFSFP